MKQETVNYTTNNIRDFKQGDTIYIKKMKGGYDFTLFCEFLSFGRGIVKGKVISADREWANRDFVGNEITARITKCMLYGDNGKTSWIHYVWFNSEGFAK